MAVLTSVLVFSLWIVCSASSGIQLMEAQLGKDVVLECRGSSNNIDLLTWIRADLGPEEYIFYFDETTPSGSKQILSYQDRVSLQDKEMKNGDISVLLKNVTISDTGTYECLTLETNKRRRKRSTELQSRKKIQLTVGRSDPVSGDHSQSGSAGLTDGGSPDAGSPRGRTGPVVPFVMVAAVMFIICGVAWIRSQKKMSDQSAV